jgi:CBS domain containing-hemolysin-like protein
VDAGFETVAGYILSRLGYIPKAGESVDFEGRRYTVTAMEHNRIARVHVEKIEPSDPEPADAGA